MYNFLFCTAYIYINSYNDCCNKSSISKKSVDDPYLSYDFGSTVSLTQGTQAVICNITRLCWLPVTVQTKVLGVSRCSVWSNLEACFLWYQPVISLIYQGRSGNDTPAFNHDRINISCKANISIPNSNIAKRMIHSQICIQLRRINDQENRRWNNSYN